MAPTGLEKQKHRERERERGRERERVCILVLVILLVFVIVQLDSDGALVDEFLLHLNAGFHFYHINNLIPVKPIIII